MAANNGNGNRAHGIDRVAVRTEASEITDAAKIIARVAEEAFETADAQVRSVDNALSGVNQI
jgi:hypothetical protein